MEIISFNEVSESFDDSIYLSFDISTSCIGVSIFDINQKLVTVKALKMKIINNDGIDTEILKGDAFKKFVKTFENKKIIDIFVEEPLVKSNNVFTVNKLLKFNGICSYILRDVLDVIPKFMSVDEVRRIFCPEMTEYNPKTGKYVLKFRSRNIDPKEYIFGKINHEYKIEWVLDKKNKLKTENFDVSDSIALAKSCFIKYYPL